MNSRRAALVLIVAGLLAYHNSFSGVFVFDDIRSIRDNPHIRRLGWSAPPQTTAAGRPLLAFSLSLNYAISGLQPWSYHAFNLAVHIAAALVLYGILARTGAGHIAWAAALLWLVHPLQTASVTYIIQRAESLMGLFYLLTLYCAIRGWNAAAVAACAAGMATKETMVTAPVAVMLYDRIFLRRTRWGLYAALAATWILPVWSLSSGVRTESVGFGLENVSAWDYAWTQCTVLLHYLRLAVWPHPLVLDYYWPVTKSVAAAFVLALLLAGTVWALVRKPRLGFLGAWVFLVLVPTSSVVPIATEMAAEHRMYLPLASVAVLVAHGCCRIRRELVFALAMLLGWLTVQRNADYGSELRIWADTVAKRPENPRAHNNLGQSLADAGRLDEAEVHFREAIRLEPRFANARYNLATVLVMQQRFEEAAAHYQQVLRVAPQAADVRVGLGLALGGLGRIEEAMAQFSEALRLNPGLANAHYNLAVALARQGKLQEAARHFQSAVELAPDFEAARRALEDLRARSGDFGAQSR